MNDLSKLSNKELLDLKQKLQFDIEEYNNLQNARKVQLNSFYGALGSEYFRFYDIRQAEAVTVSGQLVINYIKEHINNYLNKICNTTNHDYIIALDTDSLYLALHNVVQIIDPENKLPKTKIVDALDKFCSQKLQKQINLCCNDLAEYMNVYQQKMVMKRESIADKGIWIAKKRYILNVYDKEGVRLQKPKIKMMGVEAVKSSTPHAVREMITSAIEVIINENQSTLYTFVKDCYNKFKALPPEEIGTTKTANNLQKYYDYTTLCKPSTPMHVRGALSYNQLLKDKKLNIKYAPIKEGEKIKSLYLKMPNPSFNNVISINDTLPNEFNLLKYIDYDTQFDKVFKSPLESILNVIGWHFEKKNKLSGFFV